VTSAIPTSAWLQSHTTWFGVVGMVGTDALSMYSLTPRMTAIQAFTIDSKIDDGMPLTCRVESDGPNGQNVKTRADGPAQCYLMSGSYNVTYTPPSCGLLIRLTTWP